MSALGHNLAVVCAYWARCVTHAEEEVEDFSRKVAREWRVMVKDVRFAFYGGVDSPAKRAAYIGRRFDEARRSMTAYLHRPEYLALAEAFEERRAIDVAGAA